MEVKDSVGLLEIRWTDNKGFFKVYFSEDKFDMATTNDDLTCLDGEIKSIKNMTEFLEKDILALISEYVSDYDTLKTDFGIPNREDFGIQFEYSNGTVIGSAPLDVKVNIYAEKYQIPYLDKEGNKEAGYFIIYIWG